MMPHRCNSLGRLLLLASLAAGSGICWTSAVALAQPSPEQLANRIDRHFEQAWRDARLTPSRDCTDAEYLRRVSLDIIGTIPTEGQVRAYLDERSGTKRERLVERLLGSESFPRYTAVVWGNTLVGRGTGLEALAQLSFRNWLEEQFSGDVKFDALVRALITAKGSPRENPEVGWLVHHDANPENLTAAAARIFLGTQIQCAQCHDHPFDKWKQTDFYGMTAFFGRVELRRFLLSRTIQEKTTGEVRLGGADDGAIVPPRFLDGDRPGSRGDSRRDQLAEWITSPKQPQFAKATSNRVWAQFFGRGLVHPMDDLAEHNPASVPAVLDDLAEGFIDSGYDLKFLIRTITRTRVYRLSSLPSRNNAEDESLFSKSYLRRLSAEQLLASAVNSTGITENESITDNALFKLLIAAVQQQFIFVFANMDETTEVNEVQGTISQALMMMNSGPVAGATEFGLFDPLRAKLGKCPDVAAKIDLLFRSTLSRPANSKEQREYSAYFRGATRFGDQLEICEDLYWALLNSAEFTFNH